MNTTTDSMARFGRVAVIMGGNAAEREVSLVSGAAVLQSLQQAGVDAVGIDAAEDLLGQLQAGGIDRVFNVLHGRGGEDGQLQGLLEFMNLPYTGSGVLASALSMDKVMTKLVWQRLELPTPEFRMLAADTPWDEVIAAMGTVVVKPVREGSSIGMSVVSSAAELQVAYETASRFDSEVMAEQYIDGSEFSVSILGDVALPAIELRTTHRFYDYDAKYLANDTEYLCPAPLDEETARSVGELSREAFVALGCSGWG